MGAMLYLSATSAPRTAAGLSFAYGTLAFYISGTTALATVYDASDLATPLTNPVEADADGLWPDIWLDPAVTYRVILQDRYGVLAYDVDPYLPYQTDTAFQYLDAQVQALSGGAVVPGAELDITVSSAVASVYADSGLDAALPNPVVADAGGRFPPVYLDDSLTYDVNGDEYPPA